MPKIPEFVRVHSSLIAAAVMGRAEQALKIIKGTPMTNVEKIKALHEPGIGSAIGGMVNDGVRILADAAVKVFKGRS